MSRKPIRFNWNQTGMPVSLMSRRRNEFSEFKSVLNDAGGHVMQPVDAESMARELADSGGREYVEMVRELTASLANAKAELAEANRRYERLSASLAKRGIKISDDGEIVQKRKLRKSATPKSEPSAPNAKPSDALSEWESWDRKFRSLLG